MGATRQRASHRRERQGEEVVQQGRKSFALHLVKDRLLSEQQLLFQASLGVRLSDQEAKAFAIACRNGDLRLRDVKASVGLAAKDAQAVLDRLLVEVLVEELTKGNRTHVQLAEHLVERLASLPYTAGSLVSGQVPSAQANSVSDQVLTALSDTQRRIVSTCSSSLSR